MSLKIYKCFIASPSDTNEERKICKKVFVELNRGLGIGFNFRVESLMWEDDVRSEIGNDGQSIINKQIGNEYNIFIGIMYKKFGTPTSKAGSGTEEEFNLAYNRFLKKDSIEILFYFNDAAPEKMSEIIPDEWNKVNSFKSKMSTLGLYATYMGSYEFEEKLRQDLTRYFIEQFKNKSDNSDKVISDLINKESLKKTFNQRLSESLINFEGQPIVWVAPVLSTTNEISYNPDENYNNRVPIGSIFESNSSFIIKAPSQFGQTCFSHYLIKEAWERNNLWVYVDSEKVKPHAVYNYIKKEVESLEQNLEDVRCIILDSWRLDSRSLKILKNLINAFDSLRIIVMETIDDSTFLDIKDENDLKIDKKFESLYLLALPRSEIRKVVKQYNNVKLIGDEDAVLSKIVSDLETLNIHRTPYNCLTLLKVSEKYFDESPINRTKMIEMVLFVLFNIDDLPTYKNKPDLKDCEYVLGRFCENLIRKNVYEFSREIFLKNLNQFCAEKLIDLEVDVVFDVLIKNKVTIPFLHQISVD